MEEKYRFISKVSTGMSMVILCVRTNADTGSRRRRFNAMDSDDFGYFFFSSSGKKERLSDKGKVKNIKINNT